MSIVIRKLCNWFSVIDFSEKKDYCGIRSLFIVNKQLTEAMVKFLIEHDRKKFK